MRTSDRSAAISSVGTSPGRRLAADYYPLVAKSVAAVASEAARAAVYERVRRVLLDHLQSIEPRFSPKEIAAEQWALEQAIQRVEAEALAHSASNRSAAFAPAESEHAPASASAMPRKSSAAIARRPARISWVKRAAAPVIVGSGLLCAFLVYGPFSDDATPAQEFVALVFWTSALSFLLLAAVTSFDQRRRLREAGLVKHRMSAFASRRTSEEACRELAVRLSDQALLWAYFLPEHDRRAKAVVHAELERRGYAHEDLASWSPAPAEVTVPSALQKPMSLKRYAALMRFKRWLFNGYRVLTLLVAALLLYITYDLYTLDQLRNLREVVPVLAILLWVIVGVCATPFRNRALRVLLLRPFGERKMTRALRRFVCRNVGRSGNVFTLSDRNYKPNLLITLLWRVPAESFDLLGLLILGPFIRSSKRVATVKREGKFRKLERHLLRKATPAFWSFLAGDQAFNIRSSDDWWQMCIHMLMYSCEIIVIDLSKVKEGTAWELKELDAKDVLAKCVFVVGEDHVESVPPMLKRYFPDGQCPNVHVYRSNGTLADKRAFDASLDEVMAAGLAGWGEESVNVKAPS